MISSLTFKNFLGLSEAEMSQYKIHLAANNGCEEPLDVAKRDFQEWVFWNRWRGGRGNNDFNRDYIFGWIPLTDRPGKYVFGGIFKVIKRHDDWVDTEIGYDLELSDQLKELIGRLIVDFYREPMMGGRSFKMETLADRITVSAILEDTYAVIRPS